jgi:hypothetical protein
MFFTLLDAISDTGGFMEEIWTWIIDTASETIGFITALLPRSPFIDFQYNLPPTFNNIMHLFFWIFPAHQVIVHYAAIAGIFLTYYALRVAMNWVKMIGS